MKYFSWFKGFIFIALACSLTAQGSTIDFSKLKTNHQKNEGSGYSVSVSAGDTQCSHASANLTITGENSKVNVEKEGTVTLVAGKSIILQPGTKISSGGFLYASIIPGDKDSRHPKKVTKLVTLEEKEKIDEQTSLSTAADLFKPFPTHAKGLLHAEDPINGNIKSSTTQLCGVSAEQQWKVAVDSRERLRFVHKQIIVNNNLIPVAIASRTAYMVVLRL